MCMLDDFVQQWHLVIPINIYCFTLLFKRVDLKSANSLLCEKAIGARHLAGLLLAASWPCFWLGNVGASWARAIGGDNTSFLFPNSIWPCCAAWFALGMWSGAKDLFPPNGAGECLLTLLSTSRSLFATELYTSSFPPSLSVFVQIETVLKKVSMGWFKYMNCRKEIRLFSPWSDSKWCLDHLPGSGLAWTLDACCYISWKKRELCSSGQGLGTLLCCIKHLNDA